MSGRFKPARRPREAKEFRRIALDGLGQPGKSAADSARLVKDAITAKKVAFSRSGAELAIQASIGIIAIWPSGDSSAVSTSAMKRASTTPPVCAAVQW